MAKPIDVVDQGKAEKQPVVLDTCPIEPLHGNVLVADLARETETEGGIVIPDTAQRRSNRGAVYGLGPDVKGTLVLMDTVVFHQADGMKIEVDGREYRLLSEKDVLGKLR